MEKEPVKELWEILVPTMTTEGKPVRTHHHRQWDSRIRNLSGGLTILSPAKGQWVAPDGQLFVERMIPVRIAVESRYLKEIARIAMQHYNQLAVMMYKVSTDVRIVKREEVM